MRSDTKTLFERLKVGAFVYEDFADTLSDLELWPIFEVTLNDARVVGNQPLSQFHAELVSEQAIPGGAGQQRPSMSGPGLASGPPVSLSIVTPGGLFQNYAAIERTPEITVRQTADRGSSVRTILERLSQGPE